MSRGLGGIREYRCKFCQDNYNKYSYTTTLNNMVKEDRSPCNVLLKNIRGLTCL